MSEYKGKPKNGASGYHDSIFRTENWNKGQLDKGHLNLIIWVVIIYWVLCDRHCTQCFIYYSFLTAEIWGYNYNSIL